jgi:amino acid adenylation domain-containing protein
MSEDSYIFPVSFAQQRLWLLDRIAPGNPFYNIPLVIPIKASLDVPALEKALNAVVARHESLRTTFRVIDDEPAQVVHPRMELKIPVTDLRSLSVAEREARIVDLATKDAREPFDLESGPLVRCALITRGWSDHVLLLSMHHIVSDGWSMGIFAQELTVFYQSFASGVDVTLPELPIQYPDFAVWQRDWLQGEVLETQLAYWREHLRDVPDLELPTDYPRPLYNTYQGASHPVRVLPRLANQVRKFASSRGATPFMVLLSVFAALLQRYSGQDQIVIGIPVANRIRAELEGLIGFFVNSLVLRIDFSGNPSFSEMVDRVREVALGAYANQSLPFEKLVEELHPSRDPSRNPLFQVTFQLVNTPTMQSIAPPAESSTLQVQRGSAIFDIAFTLLDTADEFTGVFEYSTDLFEPATIARIERHFQQLLESALRNPEERIGSQRLVSEDEEAELIHLSHGPKLPMPDPPLVHRLIAEQANRSPDALAVESGADTLSYHELVSQAQGLANYLRVIGVGPEHCVGILMDRSADLVVALLAVLEAGGVYMPLDPTYPPDRLRYMVQDSGAKVILTQRRQQQLALDLVSDNVDVMIVDAEATDKRGAGAGSRDVELSPDNLAYVLYTSGSTGQPKAVGVSHWALTNHMAWMLDRFPLQQTDRVLQRTPYSFDASIWEFFAPLLAGATLVMLPVDAQRDPSLIVKCMVEARITVAQFVPSLLRVVLDEPAFYTCRALRRVFCGGEALADELRDRIRKSVNAEVINLYGPTEATIDSTFYVTADRSEPFGVPIGTPVSNTQAYVLDQSMSQSPIGAAGEVYLAGAALARGYIGQPGATAERFLPDPYSTVAGARMYRTGDRARRLADGALLFMGRADDLVKIRGFRIEPGEIEETIRKVEGVSDCAVVVEEGGSNLTSLLAYVVASPEQRSLVRDTAVIENEHVSRWEELYQDIYGTAASEPDALKFAGWNSSYTGLSLEAEEMAEWHIHTLERIRKLNPSRVLEIGCGTGLLLTELARDCERYVGTDVSLAALRLVESRLASLNGDRSRIELLHQRADNFDGFLPGMFDLVILNSIVQYFPRVEYLVRVIADATRIIAPGGSIFIGDVRNLRLVETFQLSLALHKLGLNSDPQEIRKRVLMASEQEEELCIDPSFFYILAANTRDLNGPEITLKRGRYSNELSRFRYDVVLRVGEAPGTEAACERLDWQREKFTLDRFLPTVREKRPDRLIVENVPNARVVLEVRLMEKLMQAGARKSLAELWREAAEEVRGAVQPEDLWQASELQEWERRITFSGFPERESFDLILSKSGSARIADPAEDKAAKLPPVWEDYASKPLRSAVTRRLTTQIREHVSSHLPDYMIPSAFVVLNELPLLPNGKLDRKALSAMNARQSHHRAYVAPRTATEQALAMIWKEVLNTDRVDIKDDFFTDLGGHSLLATQLISRIREAFHTEVPLKLVFQAPTIEQFAAALLDLIPEERAKIDNTAGLIVRLSQLSEAEVDAALSTA